MTEWKGKGFLLTRRKCQQYQDESIAMKMRDWKKDYKVLF